MDKQTIFLIIGIILSVSAILISIYLLFFKFPSIDKDINDINTNFKNISDTNIQELGNQQNLLKILEINIEKIKSENIENINSRLNNIQNILDKNISDLNNLPNTLDQKILDAKNLIEKARTDDVQRINEQINTILSSNQDKIDEINTSIQELNRKINTAQRSLQETSTSSFTLINESLNTIQSILIPQLQDNINNMSEIFKTKKLIIKNNQIDAWNIELIDDDLCVINNLSNLPPICIDRNNNLFVKK